MLLDGPLSLHYSAVSWRHTRRKLSLSLPLSANSTQQLVKSFPTQRNGVISQTRTSFCTFHINLSEYLIPIRHTTLDHGMFAELLSSVLLRPVFLLKRNNTLLLLYPMNWNWNGMKTCWHLTMPLKCWRHL